MKILRIKLSNLNSLRGTHEVNFQEAPLAGAGLFAITGPTGSGKSTLLDAITLALYGKAARYGDAPNPEDMMSRHCGECSAEVEFEVPTGIFRAEWQLRRAHGQATGKVQPPRRYVYDAAGLALAQNVREAEEKIQELVGLDYERFLRSAMLAQGEFAQFLKAKPDERAALLESLTDTAIYSELGILAHTATARRENEVKQKELLLGQIQLLSEERRKEIESAIPQTEKASVELKEELQRNTELLNKGTNLVSALQKEKSTLQAQEALAIKWKEAEKDFDRLVRHRLTIPFQKALAEQESAEATAANMRTLLQQAQKEYFVSLGKARAFLRAYGLLVTSQINACQTKFDAFGEKLKQTAQQKADAEKWLGEHEADKELPGNITSLVSELMELKNARRHLGDEWKRVGALAAKLHWEEELPRSRADFSRSNLGELLSKLNKAAKAKCSEADEASTKANIELELREDHLAKTRLMANLEQHRPGLKKGEPCPLCGSTEHPFVEGAKPALAFKELERRVVEAKELCRKLQRDQNALDELHKQLTETSKTVQIAFEEFTSTQVELGKSLKKFVLSVPSAGQEDETKLTLERRAAEYSSHGTAAERAMRDQAQAEAEQRTLAEMLKQLQEKQTILASESLPKLSQAETPLIRIPAWASLAAAERDWSAAKADFEGRKTAVENRSRDKEHYEKEASRLRAELLQRLEGSAFADIAELKSARLPETEAGRIESMESALKQRSQQLEADLRSARERIEALRKEGAPEPGALPDIRARQAEFQLKHEKLISDLANWRKDIAVDDENRKSVVERRKELDQDKERLVIWQKLKGLIGSHDGKLFRVFAQGLSLNVLAVYANKHLQNLSERYRLRRREGEDLELEIEDLHQSGAVRPMASLSGGESFLVSLALALGLSEIAGRKVRIESLFIDEGFGSLDAETLDIAISALETLHQDNKMVGVISHVDLLKERISTQIIVEKQSGGRSRVRVQ